MMRAITVGVFVSVGLLWAQQISYDELLARARSALATRDYQAAVSACQQAIGMDDHRWEGYAVAANGYSGQRLYPEAIESLQAALARTADDKKPLIREALSDLRKQQEAIPPPVSIVTTPESSPTGTYRIADVRISPDGKMVLFTGERGGSKHIYAVALDGSAPRPITREGRANDNGRWSPDSKSIVFLSDRGGSRQVWTIGADGSHPVGLTSVPAGTRGAAVSTRNDIVYFALDHLFRLKSQRDGAALVPDRSVMADYDISPDGTELCNVSETNSASNLNLYVAPMAGGASRRITTNPVVDRSPAYSPDGKSIAYRAQVSMAGDSNLWQLLVLQRMTGKVTNLTEAFNLSVKTFIWAPDSGALLFVVDVNQGSNVLRVPVTGGAYLVAVSDADERISEIQLAPDGKSLLFLAQKGSEFPKLYRASSSGGKPVVVAP